MRPPTTRAICGNVEPECVYLTRDALLTALGNHETALFCRYAAIRVLTDIKLRKDISPCVLKNVGRNTSENMASLATLIRAIGFASARRMSTGYIQIHLHRPMLQFKGSVENACALRGMMPHQSDMAKYKAQSKLLPVENTPWPDLQEIGEAMGRAVG